MKLSPLQPMNHNQICVSGEVTIHPNAVIAPGVLLQADPDSRIVIAAGACIGMGTILHANTGTLKVEESANLGTGVLFIGHGTIGAHACIGSSSTIFNTDVQSQTVLPSGSLLGDPSRQVQIDELNQTEPKAAQIGAQPNPPQPKSANAEVKPPDSGQDSENTTVPSTSKLSSKENTQTAATAQAHLSIETSVSEVYGRAYVNQLLGKLMPHKQQLNQSLDDS